jgi:uncharacterized protein YlaI
MNMQAEEIVCRDCNKTFYVSGRGRRPIRCVSCRGKASKQAKENKLRTFVCEKCKQTIAAPTKGRLPKICKECKQKEASVKNNSEKKERKYVCAICGQEKLASSRGKMPKVCKDCKTLPEAGKASKENKQKEPRKFTCKFCNGTFETTSRGRLPMACKACKETNKEHKAYVKTNKKLKTNEFMGKESNTPVYTKKNKIHFEIVEKGTNNRLSSCTFSSFSRATDFAQFCSKGKEFEVREVKKEN